jgi:hypothetical protein
MYREKDRRKMFRANKTSALFPKLGKPNKTLAGRVPFVSTSVFSAIRLLAQFRQEQSTGNFAVNVDLNAKLSVKVWAFKIPGPKAKITCKLSVPAPGAANASPFQPTDCKLWF